MLPVSLVSKLVLLGSMPSVSEGMGHEQDVLRSPRLARYVFCPWLSIGSSNLLRAPRVVFSTGQVKVQRQCWQPRTARDV